MQRALNQLKFKIKSMINIGENTIKDTEEKIIFFSKFNDYKSAYLYCKELSESVKMADVGDRKNNRIFFDQINRQINKLKFIALNYFGDFEEIGELILKYFDLALQLPDYDIWEKIKINLLAVSDLRKRSEAKELIKNKLLNSDCRILDAHKYKNIKNLPITVARWLKDYHANLGLGKIDNLKKIEYLTNGEFIRNLIEEDRNKLKILFDFYEKIKVPSSDQYGFEGEVPMVVDGKNVIFSNGETEEIPQSLLKMIREVKITDVDEIGGKSEELERLASQYPAGSFERKAVEEEIGRITREL